MAPVPFRGKRNDSSLIAYVAETIAAVRGTEPQQLIDQCRENANRLFGIE
jgi:TatD DNase family protein